MKTSRTEGSYELLSVSLKNFHLLLEISPIRLPRDVLLLLPVLDIDHCRNLERIPPLVDMDRLPSELDKPGRNKRKLKSDDGTLQWTDFSHPQEQKISRSHTLSASLHRRKFHPAVCHSN
jgi:hypothetical protein